MDFFLKINRSFLTYFLIFLIIIPIFGFNFFVSLLGNIILLLFLIPLLLLLIAIFGFNSFKSKFKTCNDCGAISLGLSNTCTNCGASFEVTTNENQVNSKPSESTIEIKAEEIK